MKLIRLEAHLFRENCEQPSFSNVSVLIDKFHQYELMPQYVMENNSQTGEKTKRMQLTNQIENLSITFQSDKLLIARDFSPNKQECFNVETDRFLEFLKFSLDELRNLMPEFKSHRVSLVGNSLYFLDTDTRGEIAKKLTSPIIENEENEYSEIKFRFGVRTQSDVVDEKINNVVTLNDGEAEIVEDGQSNKSLCLLNNIDINTLGETKQARFDMDTSLSLIKSYRDLLGQRLDQLEQFFKG